MRSKPCWARAAERPYNKWLNLTVQSVTALASIIARVSVR